MVGAIIALVLVVGAVFLIIAAIKSMAKEKKRLAAKKQEVGATDIVPALHWEGLGLIKQAPCDLYLLPEKLVIEHRNQKFEIPTDRIRAADFKTEQELQEKGKSVVGRAVIGTLLVPGLGTIVGGMSGIGKKKVKKGPMNHFLIINYINSTGELTGVTLFNNLNTIRLQMFAKSINKGIQSKNTEGATIVL